MGAIEESRHRRSLLMKALFDTVGDDELAGANWRELSTQLNFTDDQMLRAMNYLKGEGLIKMRTFGTIGITHRGICEMEEAIKAPDRPTTHFVPYVNIVNVEHMHESQIQQGNVGSTQTYGAGLALDGAALEQLVQLIKDGLQEAGLSAEGREQVAQDVATLEQAARAKRINPVIVRELLRSIRSIMEGTTGSLIASGIVDAITRGLR